MTLLKTSPLHFIALTLEEIRQHYPRYAREDIQCFLVVKDAPNSCSEPVGLYGLIDRGGDTMSGARQGEGFLTIFPAFQFRVLNKRFFAALFDHALNMGFAKVYTWTRLKSWQKLFQRFEGWGIERLESPPPWDEERGENGKADCRAQVPSMNAKVWFVKQKVEREG